MFGFFRRFWPLIREYKFHFLMAILGSILVAASTAASAYLVKPVLDDIFIAQNAALLYSLPFFVVLAYFAKGAGGFIQGYFMQFVGQDIVRRITNILLGRFFSFELDFFNRNKNGELLSRTLYDTQMVSSAVSIQLIEILREGLTIFGLIFVVIYNSPFLAFFGLIVMPIAFLPVILISRKVRKISRAMQAKNADTYSFLAESFNNTELVKANCAEKFESKRFDRHISELFALRMKSIRTELLNSPIMETIGAIAIAIVIIIGGRQVLVGQITTGAFFSFTAALFMLYTPFKKISSLITAFQNALAASERIFTTLERKSKIKDGIEILKENIEKVEYKSVGLCYEADSIESSEQKFALKNINLEIKKGECIALVGDSGGGKSSFVNLLLRLYDASVGEILINGKNLKNLVQSSLRAQIAIVSQRVFILNDTIAANVAYGADFDEFLAQENLQDSIKSHEDSIFSCLIANEKADLNLNKFVTKKAKNEVKIDEEKVKAALISARLWDFVEKLPDGIHTKLDEFGSNLSGGQRQRIAIARAIYREPKILILDEATSALDNKTEEEFKSALSEIIKDKITIIIAHRLSTISLAQKIYFFSQGEILAQGKHEQLLANCENYKKYYQIS